MRSSIAVAFVVSALCLAACGGDATPPIKPPPPPDPLPPPVTTSETTDAPTPTEEPPKKLEDIELASIKAMSDAWAARDPKKLAERYAGDAAVTVYGQGDLTGRDAVAADAQKWLDGFADLKLAVGRVVSKGDMAVVEWAFTGTHTGDFAGTKATQRSLGALGVSVLWFNVDGLVTKEHRIVDVATLLAQDDKRAKPASVRPPPQLPTSIEMHSSKGGPDEEKLVDLARQLHDAIAAKKEPEFLALLADDVTVDDLVQPRPLKGPKETKGLVAMITRGHTEAKVSAKGFAADDLVVSVGELTSTVKGKPLETHFVTVLQIKAGKVAHMRRYAVAKELADSLLPPSPAQPKKPQKKTP